MLAIPLHKIELVENDCHQLFYYNPQEKLVGFISISFLYDQQVVAVCLLVKYADYEQLARENYLKQLKIIRSKIF